MNQASRSTLLSQVRKMPPSPAWTTEVGVLKTFLSGKLMDRGVCRLTEEETTPVDLELLSPISESHLHPFIYTSV